MVYTVTLNPSIDYVMRFSSLEVGKTNRTENVEYMAGGKGINVSRMLTNLGVENLALGVLAGNGGKWFENIVKSYGIQTNFQWLKQGETRINVKLKNEMETEINASGPIVNNEEEEGFLSNFSMLQAGDIVVLAGSVAKGFSTDIYEKIMQRLNERKVNIVVDTSGSKLLEVLKYRPLLVKPNIDELGEVFGVDIVKREDAVLYGKKLIELGAQNVIVSMGADGAVMITASMEDYYVPAISGKVINSVGAGDSMVGGFIYAYEKKMMPGEMLKMAVACGCASTFSKEIATKNEVNKIDNLLTMYEKSDIINLLHC